MHDYVSKILPMSTDQIYKFNYEIQEDHQTRKSNQIYIERSNWSLAGKLPLYNFPLIWNGWYDIISHMFLREAISRNNWTILYYHHVQIQWPTLTKDAETVLETGLLSISI